MIDSGDSAFHLACRENQVDVILVLLKHSANIQHENKLKQLPFQLMTNDKRGKLISFISNSHFKKKISQ